MSGKPAAKGPMAELPKSPDSHSYGIQFECLTETVASGSVLIRVIGRGANGAKTMKRLEIPIEKQCAGGNKAVQGTFYKGLNVMSETGGLVVVDGEATSNWEVKGDNDKASTTIDAYQISSRFTVRYDGGTTDELLLASPFTIVEDPTVVTVQTFGPLESGEFKLTSSSVPLTVQYTCLQAGQSTITIGLTSDEDLNVKTIWSFTKTCQVAEAVEGVSLEGLMVGT